MGIVVQRVESISYARWINSRDVLYNAMAIINSAVKICSEGGAHIKRSCHNLKKKKVGKEKNQVLADSSEWEKQYHCLDGP